MYIPPSPKPPTRKPYGKCEGCCFKADKRYKSMPKPSKPIPPNARLTGGESSGFFGAAIFSLAGIALFMLGFIAAMELVR